jgi:hypothetical protein
MKRTRRLLLLGVALAVWSGSSACIFYVDADASAGGSGAAAAPFATIAAATARARAGDSIVVRPGFYRENVTVPRGVHLRSERVGAAIVHGGARRDGGNPTIHVSTDAIVEGFVITGGYNGIRCDGGAPTLRNNLIRANYGDGGISAVNGCAATIVNNTILGNLGNSSNWLSSGIYVEASSPRVRNNIIVGNDFGFAPYGATPDEDYNLLWNNRRATAYARTPGAHTLLVDPSFVDVSLDDYRLAAASPARGAGDPAMPAGGRADLGCFGGAEDRPVPSPVQEYLMESVLNATDRPTGLSLTGLSRMTRDPILWFDPALRDRAGATSVSGLIESAVAVLTNGALRATFSDAATEPSEGHVRVTFDGAQGTPWYHDPSSGACLSTDPGSFDPSRYRDREEAGAVICGGHLRLPTAWTDTDITSATDISTVMHELGHVFGLDHAFVGDHQMAYGKFCCPTTYSWVEVEAFRHIYAHSAGFSWADFKTARILDAAARDPFPRIDQILSWDGTSWSNVHFHADGTRAATPVARRGDWLILKGSRLTLRWKTERDVSVRPADYSLPVVTMGRATFTADLDHQRCPPSPGISACAAGEPTNLMQGAPARYLKVQVPASAVSGWVYVTAHNSTSVPVWLDVE